MKSKLKLKALRKSGVSVRVICDEACALDASLLATVRRAILSKVGDLTLAAGRRSSGRAREGSS